MIALRKRTCRLKLLAVAPQKAPQVLARVVNVGERKKMRLRWTGEWLMLWSQSLGTVWQTASLVAMERYAACTSLVLARVGSPHA